MERFVRGFKVFWRAERFLKQKEFGLMVQRVQLNVLAALVAVFGLVMLSLAIFFALVPYLGQSLAALCVGGFDLLLALGLMFYSASLKPVEEIDIVREMRDKALKDMEEEIALAEAELTGLRDDARRFIRNPIDVLLPAAIGPLLSAVSKGVRSAKKQADRDEET
ncbi:MAG: phage holin family protein [Desulforhopalus sp.]